MSKLPMRRRETGGARTAIAAAFAQLNGSPLKHKDPQLWRPWMTLLEEASQGIEQAASDEARDELVADLVRRLDGLLLELYGRRSRYAQLAEGVGRAEREAAERFLEAAMSGTKDFFAERHARILADFDREHGALTGARDTGRGVALHGKRALSALEGWKNEASRRMGWQLEQTDRFRVSSSDEREAKSLEERLVEQHLGRDDVERALKAVMSSAEAAFVGRWEKAAHAAQSPRALAFLLLVVPHLQRAARSDPRRARASVCALSLHERGC